MEVQPHWKNRPEERAKTVAGARGSDRRCTRATTPVRCNREGGGGHNGIPFSDEPKRQASPHSLASPSARSFWQVRHTDSGCLAPQRIISPRAGRPFLEVSRIPCGG